jgi:hypothetical protein
VSASLVRLRSHMIRIAWRPHMTEHGIESEELLVVINGPEQLISVPCIHLEGPFVRTYRFLFHPN